MTSETAKNHQRCMVCQGRKKYSPLGHIEIMCVTCDGVGYTIRRENEIVLSSAPHEAAKIEPLKVDKRIETSDELLEAKRKRKELMRAEQSARMKMKWEQKKMLRAMQEAKQ